MTTYDKDGCMRSQYIPAFDKSTPDWAPECRHHHDETPTEGLDGHRLDSFSQPVSDAIDQLVSVKEEEIGKHLAAGIPLARMKLVNFSGQPHYQELWVDGKPVCSFLLRLKCDLP